MLYDLNVPWSGTNAADLQRTISFLSERKFPLSSSSDLEPPNTNLSIVNYTVLALAHTITSIPAQINNPIPRTPPSLTPQSTTLLRRCTLCISDPAQNHRLPAIAQAYDILALRPTTEAAFKAACATLEHHSLISLDLTVRYPFHFRPAAFKTARARGIKFEICYAQAVQDTTAAEKRRNFISNVLAIVRASGGRGLVVSSEARSVLGVRAPADVANLLAVWGVPGEYAKEAVTVTPRSVVANEGIRRSGYRGIIDVVGGEAEDNSFKEENTDQRQKQKQKQSDPGSGNGKDGRKKNKMMHEDSENGAAQEVPPMSKRQAKKLRLAARDDQNDASSPGSWKNSSSARKCAAPNAPSTANNKSKT